MSSTVMHEVQHSVVNSELSACCQNEFEDSFKFTKNERKGSKASTAATDGRPSFAQSEVTLSSGDDSFSFGRASFSILDDIDEPDNIAMRPSFQYENGRASFSILDDFDEQDDIAAAPRMPRTARTSFEYGESEALVSCLYNERYGKQRPSFMVDDDGTVTVFKVESIKKELGIRKPGRRPMFRRGGESPDEGESPAEVLQLRKSFSLLDELPGDSMVEHRRRPQFEL